MGKLKENVKRTKTISKRKSSTLLTAPQAVSKGRKKKQHHEETGDADKSNSRVAVRAYKVVANQK